MDEADRVPDTAPRGARDGDVAIRNELVEDLSAALDPYFGESDPSAYVARFADEATYFDPNSAGRIDGDAYRQHFAGYAGQIPPFDYRIANPTVDLNGDTAVLTFNLEVIDPENGTLAVLWNTTEVHRRTEDGWEMVHAHWSYAETPA